MRAREILEAALYVDDLDAAERFYRGVLGLRRIALVPERHVFFQCGGRVLLLFRADATRQGGTVPAHGADGAGHVAFAATAEELDAWRAHLAGKGVAVEAEHTWPGGGQSLYFRDPAGNSLEIATPSVWGIPDQDTLGAPKSASS
jgi:catechol 2,3-dioxygenase-like lactoylglutathione lyase family enzyme